MKIPNKKLFEDFLEFSQLQIDTWDIDPTYPLLKKVYDERGYRAEQALWHTIVYLTFYHLGSAELFLKEYPHPTRKIKWKTVLPTGTERRGFRGRPDLVQDHLKAICNNLPLETWLGNLITNDSCGSWTAIREEYKKIKYAGDWSSYKLADLLKWVHDAEITAPDFGVGGGGEDAGPIPGLSKLTGLDWKECASNTQLQMDFYELCTERMLTPFVGLDQCETSLCDFNSMVNGRYYVGHDIDQQQEFLETCQPTPSQYIEARKNVFPHKVLGELNGWSGVNKQLKSVYKDTGRIHDPYSHKRQRNKR
jgi:hypothetical protein